MRNSTGNRYQVFQGGPDLGFVPQAGPGLNDRVITGDQDGDGLIGHSVQVEDVLLLVQSPHDSAGPQQLVGPIFGGFE